MLSVTSWTGPLCPAVPEECGHSWGGLQAALGCCVHAQLGGLGTSHPSVSCSENLIFLPDKFTHVSLGSSSSSTPDLQQQKPSQV